MPMYALLCLPLLTTSLFSADAPRVTISTDFPGGNGIVVSNTGGKVELKPDLRGGRDWFYWSIEVTADRPGRVAFSFPEKVGGFKNGAIGAQGVAVSNDGGATYDWMGVGSALVEGRVFEWEFKEAGESVRFASTLPYVQQHFDRFIAPLRKSPRLSVETLTQSRSGRDVELLRIGQPDDERIAVLVTCRHHACETVASYLLEGFVAEALSDSPAVAAFREACVLYVVPFVDKDGVQAGDQGKNRQPHDHNRDYAGTPIYPEVRAIKTLGVEHDVRAALDLHCPTLVMDIHQLMYFAGPRDVPEQNETRVTTFAKSIKDGLPEDAPFGPLVWLKPAEKDKNREKHFSGFFSKRPGMLMACTLETPFAPRKAKMSPDDVRNYGAVVFRAWAETVLNAK